MNLGVKPDIFVDYEYGDLREVVVGVPYAIYPDYKVARWAQESTKVLPEAERKKIRERSGKDTYELGKYELMEEENLKLISILQDKHGVRVWRPDVLYWQGVAQNFGEDWIRFAGVVQQYTRDPVTVIGNNVIENTMGSLYRRADILGFRKLFLDRLLGSDARWVAMPGVDYSLMIREGLFEKTGFPVLEGGDVIVLGKTVLVGISANPATGSSELGYQWLKSYLGPMGYEVKDVPLQKEILHLDIALSVPRPGLIIVCPDAFVRGIEEYFPKHEWKTIMFSVEEATHLAINGLPINQDTYVIGTNEHFDAEKLERDLNDHGVRTVYRIPFAHHTEDGGSIRCSTHPLVRRMR